MLCMHYTLMQVPFALLVQPVRGCEEVPLEWSCKGYAGVMRPFLAFSELYRNWCTYVEWALSRII